MLEAATAARDGNALRAGELYHRAWQQDGGERVQTAAGLARALLDQGEVKSAGSTLRVSLGRVPDGDRHRLLALLAEVREAVGDRPGALAALTEAADRTRPDPEVLRRLGGLRLASGDYGGAVIAYSRLVEGRGAETPDERNLAIALTRQGRGGEALLAWGALLGRPGATVEDRFRAARLAASLDPGVHPGAPGQARRWLEWGLQARPQDFEGHVKLAELRLATGDAVGAREAYSRAAELDPGDVGVLAQLIRLETAAGNGSRARLLLAHARDLELTPAQLARIEAAAEPAPEVPDASGGALPEATSTTGGEPTPEGDGS